MYILALNCGSSSLKYQVFDADSKKYVVGGNVEKIGLPDSFITQKYPDGTKTRKETEMKNHNEALNVVLFMLREASIDMNEIGGVGHRVVMGGDKFASSVEITDEVMRTIDELSPIAPLHNPPALMGIVTAQQLLPNARQVAVFDTAFHQTMPPIAYRFAIPKKYYTEYGIRRYGAHGTSHMYLSQQAALYLNKPLEETNVITCHLGGGASVAAVKGGKCVDTSMGLTPLDGLVMGTRCGSIDPSVVFFLCDRFNMSVEEVKEVFNKKSGLLALSEISSDMRPICEGYEKGEPNCTLAMDMFCYRLAKFISSYYVPLGHVDAIIFSGGIGENCWEARKITCAMLKESLGIEINEELNEKALGRLGFEGGELSTPNSKVKVFMIPTNEELVIARSAMKFVK